MVQDHTLREDESEENKTGTWEIIIKEYIPDVRNLIDIMINIFLHSKRQGRTNEEQIANEGQVENGGHAANGGQVGNSAQVRKWRTGSKCIGRHVRK